METKDEFTTVALANSMKEVDIKKYESVIPDSTTQMEKNLCDYYTGQDVLVQKKDGKYYCGTVAIVDNTKGQCLVKYGNNTEHWSLIKDLSKLSYDLEHEDLLCVICKKSSPKHEDNICMCDRCGRGYHRKCHVPEIPPISFYNAKHVLRNDGTGNINCIHSQWICKRCTDSEPNKLKKQDLKYLNYQHDLQQQSKNDMTLHEECILSSCNKVLPYEVVLIKKTNLLDCDTSSDETWSKSTLDLIIPPLKDFEGKNNPFLGLLKMGIDGSNRRKRGTDITLPLSLKTVISGKPMLPPMKRQLSEKDIIIGPNGEIRRKKRFRRNRSNMIVNNYRIGQPASKTATVLPTRSLMSRNGDRDGGGVDVGSNLHVAGITESFINPFSDVRRLRQRPLAPVEKGALPLSLQNTTKQSPTNSVVITSKLSPVKTEPLDIDMQDLKSSVNIYFGAANRIARGERFTLLAKRVGPMGKVEFLIEWESLSGQHQ